MTCLKLLNSSSNSTFCVYCHYVVKINCYIFLIVSAANKTRNANFTHFQRQYKNNVFGNFVTACHLHFCQRNFFGIFTICMKQKNPSFTSIITSQFLFGDHLKAQLSNFTQVFIVIYNVI